MNRPSLTQINTSRRDAATGNPPHPGSRGVTLYHADTLNSFSPDPELSARALLERGYVAQALIDSTAMLFCFLFLLCVALSFPLALFLLLFARF